MADSAESVRTTDATESAHHGVVHLPGVSVPHVSVSGMPVPQLHLRMPTGRRGRLLWWGGLAAVAAAGVVDWPVAALVAAGSWVAEQSAKAGRESDRPHKADE